MKKRLADNGHPFVPNVHCPPHQLNLVLVHTAESSSPPPSVEINFFVNSNHR